MDDRHRRCEAPQNRGGAQYLLRKAINGITQHMLTAQLREVENDGLITRTVFAEVPPRVEYEMTASTCTRADDEGSLDMVERIREKRASEARLTWPQSKKRLSAQGPFESSFAQSERLQWLGIFTLSPRRGRKRAYSVVCLASVCFLADFCLSRMTHLSRERRSETARLGLADLDLNIV